ncbi:MAG TPA: hypothetical protein VGD99_23480 [Anaerolineae bacterium]
MSTSADSNEAQIKRTVEQLYESEGLTGALTDEAASLLLKWGEQQLKSLAASNYDEAGWESAAYQLRRIVGSINRLVERQADLSENELVQRLMQLVERSIKFAAPKSMSSRGATDDEETQIDEK